MANESAVSLAKSLLRDGAEASLATLDATGAPFVSLVIFATGGDDAPILLLSRLARHTQNLARDPRASLMVSDRPGGDAQARVRATFIGRIAPLTDAAAIEDARRRFLARHPSATTYAGFSDFRFHAMVIESVHMVQGFGRIYEFDGKDLP